ncbi:hypothetical protein GCM10027435_14030 [Haloparvum alkalitolerans]|uniref:hypothetical protein n=1 Tax=Haloparvum alkalitolerans TaxID=1042953 RepID=UPI003CFACCEF
MDPTRRRLLAAGAGLAGASSAGCLGGGSGVEYPDNESGAASGGAAADTAADGTVNERVGERVENEALAEVTANILDEIHWFATRYPDAIRTYVAATTRIVEAIIDTRERIVAAGKTDPEWVDALAGTTDEEIPTASDPLEPHFSPEAFLNKTANRHLEIVRRFVRRGDTERVVEELERMETSFRSLSSAKAATERHPRDPINNRLRRWLTDDPTDPFVFGLRYPTEDFAGFAYDPTHVNFEDTAPMRLRGDPVAEERRASVDERLGPVRQSADRTDELYVSVARWPTRPFDGHPDRLGGQVVHVQRYTDAEAAAAALDRVVAAGATEGRDDPLGSTPWHRYYFPHGNGVMYGYVARAGEALIAFGFSGTAWEERVSWRGPLTDCWLATV